MRITPALVVFPLCCSVVAAAAIPIPDEGKVKPRRRSLSNNLTPILALLQPLLDGANAGLQEGAGNLKAAVQDAGATLDQAANGVGVVAADTAAGAGQTVAQAPGAVLGTVHAIDHSPGVVGQVEQTLFGQ